MRTPSPAAIVIFGATGDLTQRKLVPALYSLATQQLLAPETAIVGAARSDLSDDEFRERMRTAVEKHARVPIDEDIWDGFARRLSYVSVPFDDTDAYARLRTHLEDLDTELGTRGNRLFYLATAPEFFPVIAEHLGGAGLAEEPDDAERFARLVVEKPFGSDLESARELNARLNVVFRERQVYRIDHYLGKETVQNILVLRFGNAIFEPVWNRRYIDHVQITVAEDLGVGTRGGYYDRVRRPARHRPEPHAAGPLDRGHGAAGALREPRGARREGQGAAGDPALRRRPGPPRRGARPVRARAGSPASACPATARRRASTRSSATETFVAVRVVVDNWRWAGTPFYLRTGKRLPRRATEVAIQFKPAPHLPFASTAVETLEPNLLLLRIQPDEGASLRFLAKVPGPQIDLRVVSMDFAYGSSFLRSSPEAYERLLLDALLGDSTLFTRWDEVERAWEILDPLIEVWEDETDDLHEYEAGTWGPEAADRLMERDGREWRHL